jgi:hypothetical protein
LYFIGIIREERIQLLRSNADTNSYFSGKGPRSITERRNQLSSVADPDPNPDPKDPYVSGPPGSEYGSISQRYGSGSVPYPSIIKQKYRSKKNIDSYCFVTSL